MSDTRTILFTDTSTNLPASWDWDFGDESPHGTTQNPIHNYPYYDTEFSVTLIATNNIGSSTITKTITTGPEPILPIAWWSGDGTPNDSTTNHLDGSWNYPATYATGVVNDCFALNGTYPASLEAITVPYNSLFNFGQTDTFTLRFLVKIPTGNINTRMFIAKTVYFVGIDWGISVRSDDGVHVTVQSTMQYAYPSPPTDVDMFTYVNDGDWHEIVWSYENMENNFYLDRVLKNTQNGIIGQNTYKIMLFQGNGNFIGYFDEVKLFGQLIIPVPHFTFTGAPYINRPCNFTDLSTGPGISTWSWRIKNQSNNEFDVEFSTVQNPVDVDVYSFGPLYYLDGSVYIQLTINGLYSVVIPQYSPME